MNGLTSTAPTDISLRVRNASTTLNIKMPIETAKRWLACQSSAWNRPSSRRRAGRRRRGLMPPYSKDHQKRRRRSGRLLRSLAAGLPVARGAAKSSGVGGKELIQVLSRFPGRFGMRYVIIPTGRTQFFPALAGVGARGSESYAALTICAMKSLTAMPARAARSANILRMDSACFVPKCAATLASNFFTSTGMPSALRLR